eukprot:Tbor_TRINITY_DN5825_c2_g3::TRINITY_DN5825_c2_g3_i1::g.6679::m.6679
MVEIRLNVYHLIASDNSVKTVGKDVLDIIGMGIYHSGLEVFGQEISFGGDPTGKNHPSTPGIFFVDPKSACSHFKEQIVLGNVTESVINERRLDEILTALAPNWRAASYNLLSHNCNSFTYALAEAIDPSLIYSFPKYVNRLANTGTAVIPPSLVNTLMNTINPPMAFAPELVNIIDIPSIVAVPPPMLPPQPVEEMPDPKSTPPAPASVPASAGSVGGLIGGIMRKAKETVSVTATHLKASFIAHVDSRDMKDFRETFPTDHSGAPVNPSDLISAYTVTVVHINRLQRAKLFVTTHGIYIKGSNALKCSIPFKYFRGVAYGTMVMPSVEQGTPLPTYTICHNHSNGTAPEVNCLLIFVSGHRRDVDSNKLCMIPISNFVFGHLARMHNVLRNATGYIDGLWKASLQ